MLELFEGLILRKNLHDDDRGIEDNLAKIVCTLSLVSWRVVEYLRKEFMTKERISKPQLIIITVISVGRK